MHAVVAEVNYHIVITGRLENAFDAGILRSDLDRAVVTLHEARVVWAICEGAL